MMGRSCAVGMVVSVVVLGPAGRAHAGGASNVPAVRVVAPARVNGVARELDDLPAPQLEVVRRPASVDVPVVPAFERGDGDANTDERGGG